MLSYRTFCISWTVFLAFVALIFGLFHVISACKYKNKGPSIKFPPTLYISFLLILAGLGTILSLILELTTDFCLVAIHYGPTMYIIFKACLYSILVSRLWIVYSIDSVIAYNRKKLQIWIGVILFWSVFNAAITNMTVSHIFVEDAIPKCQVLVALYAVASIALLDIISGAINIILFIRPLILLYRLKTDNNLKYIAMKQCILSVTAIVSTIISLLILGILNAYLFAIGIDIIISTLSIILMYKWNSWIADKLFICCLPSKSVLKDIKNLEICNSTETQTDKESTNKATNVHSVNNEECEKP